MYTIKEVSKMINMTEHTIRHYTDNGLVPTIKRDKNNNRLFDQESIDWLNSARYLRACGMSVKEVKYYINLYLHGDSTIPERYEIISKQKQLVEIQLQETSKRYQFIKAKEKRYSNILKQYLDDNTNSNNL
ncbi:MULTISPECIES: MerR family transcriptional regulator [unclassified Clostridium]|uniref:MerR family transcriptional regulator n=1 Tax=unclassified Clostridium TaxID=2614128 RepID=UPI0002983268|nr:MULTISPECIES: MerR family transcriptional regulator [unclassified Clostridium]EKQ53636.1 MAG: putative transcriptional regulator [Clostridium sp. Maddingley MBC34-26]